MLSAIVDPFPGLMEEAARTEVDPFALAPGGTPSAPIILASASRSMAASWWSMS